MSDIKKRSFFLEWGVPVIGAVILAFLINKFIVFKVEVPSKSMVPTLNVDDRLFARRVYKPENLERGDLVIFYSEEKDLLMIKRLIGLPNDEVIIDSGKVSVNGEELVEDYIGKPDNLSGEYSVPSGKYFFLGDNRAESFDSRAWDNTFIDEKDIKGEAFIKVSPLSDFGFVNE